MSGVYLIQPSYLKDTNKYKFGLSISNLNNRIKSYGKLTTIIFKLYTNIPRKIENILKIIFKDNVYANSEYISYNNLENLKILFFNVIISCNILYKFFNKTNDKIILFNFDLKKKLIHKKKINYENKKIIKMKNTNQNKKNCKSYNCLRCNHTFYNKTYFVKHLKRKFKCSIINYNIDFEIITTDILLNKIENNLYDNYYQLLNSKKYKCKFCDKFYTNSQNALRHSKTCIYNPLLLN